MRNGPRSRNVVAALLPRDRAERAGGNLVGEGTPVAAFGKQRMVELAPQPRPPDGVGIAQPPGVARDQVVVVDPSVPAAVAVNVQLADARTGGTEPVDDGLSGLFAREIEVGVARVESDADFVPAASAPTP